MVRVVIHAWPTSEMQVIVCLLAFLLGFLRDTVRQSLLFPPCRGPCSSLWHNLRHVG